MKAIQTPWIHIAEHLLPYQYINALFTDCYVYLNQPP